MNYTPNYKSRMIIQDIREHPQYEWIKSMLDKRGLDILEDREWEKRDSQNPDFSVFIGPVLLNKKIEMLVALYPNRVYQIDNYTKWWIAKKENCIPVKKTLKLIP
jgi:hypothetical protein